jgi:predicted acylesterase/phospholipase RssA
MSNNNSQKQIHLLCSSGGVRCYSYIGAYKALVNAGYSVSGVTASSMGSVIGLLICMGLSPQQIEDKILANPVKKYLRKRVWHKYLALFRYPYAIYHHPDYATFLEDVFGADLALKDLSIPYSTLALDLNKQQLLSISRDTHPDWKASKLLSIATAIPALFSPIEIGDMLLVDGGMASESPGWVAGAESEGRPVVILRNFSDLQDSNKAQFSKFIESTIQAAAAGNDAFSLKQIPSSITIKIPCGNQQAEDFSISAERIRALILAGEKAMEDVLTLCGGDLTKFIRIENIAPTNKNDIGLDLARERNIALLQKFNRQISGRHQIFICYSHKDQLWFNKLQLMLAPVEAFHGIKVWDDKEIMPGTYWHDAIKNALSQTKLAICLVSRNFINSSYITAHELKYFMEEAEKQKVKIFPISISRIEEHENPLKNIQFVNNPSEPLDEQESETQHAVLSDMVDKLIDIIRQEE